MYDFIKEMHHFKWVMHILTIYVKQEMLKGRNCDEKDIYLNDLFVITFIECL